MFAVVRWSGLALLIRHVVQRHRATIVLHHDTTPQTLDRQLAVLGALFNFVPLRDYVEAVKAGSLKTLPPRPLIFTLDDGHKCNYELTDVFRKHGVTPTLFACTGLLGTNRRFWWEADISPEEVERLKRIPDHTRVERLMKVGHTDTTVYPTRSALSIAEINAMREVFDFQPHTMFHPILPRCSDERAWSEISESKRVLANEHGFDTYAFAYPNGSYSDRELEYLAKAGYQCAITTRAGFNSARTPLLELKRIGMTDGLSASEIIARASGLPAWWGEVIRRRSHAVEPATAATPPVPDSASSAALEPVTERLKIVIVARHFPPESNAGAMRPWRQAELLGRRGHDVTVITAANKPLQGPYTVVTVPHRSPGEWARILTRGSSSSAISEDFQGRLGMNPRLAARAVTFAKQALVWLQGGTIWGIRSGLKTRALARDGRLDLLVTSSPPYAVHWAGLLARRRVMTWVMDYRDLYTTTAYPEGKRKGPKRAFEGWFEGRCLRLCDAVTVTSPGNESTIRRINERVRIEWAPTGVWGTAPDDAAAEVPARVPGQPLTILYTGILYNGLRDPEPLIEALRIMRATRTDGTIVKAVFMGADCDHARHVAERHGVSEAVELTGPVSAEEARASQQDADALLLIGMEGWVDSDSQAVPQKLWEYMESGRLIIATGFPADGYVAKLLRGYRLSIVSDDPQRIAERLAAYSEGRFGVHDADDAQAMDAGELATVPTSDQMVDVLESLARTS